MLFKFNLLLPLHPIWDILFSLKQNSQMRITTMTTLYHGSRKTSAPVIGLGVAANSGENIFDGLFASDSQCVAASHAENVFAYEVESIATNSDLDAEFEKVYAFLREELNIDDVDEIADRVMYDNDSDIEDFADILNPRLDSDISGAYSWELQRLRGRVAAHLGFDAVEMDDEHGTSYLIVNPLIVGVAV